MTYDPRRESLAHQCKTKAALEVEKPDLNAYFRTFYPEDWEDPRAYKASAYQSLGCTRDYIGKGERCFRFPRIECADGFSLSVQGHSGAYCRPRGDFEDRYTMVEIGFPSAREELIMPYIDGGEDTDPTQTVYGYVPVELVEQVITKHGGFARPAPVSPSRDEVVRELCGALETLRAYAAGMIEDGLPHSPTLPSAVARAAVILRRARGQ